MQGIGYRVIPQFVLRMIGQEAAIIIQGAHLGESEAAASIDIMITQINHEIVIDSRFVRHRVVEGTQQDVIETELVQAREYGDFRIERLPTTGAHGVFAQ